MNRFALSILTILFGISAYAQDLTPEREQMWLEKAANWQENNAAFTDDSAARYYLNKYNIRISKIYTLSDGSGSLRYFIDGDIVERVNNGHICNFEIQEVSTEFPTVFGCSAELTAKIFLEQSLLLISMDQLQSSSETLTQSSAKYVNRKVVRSKRTVTKSSTPAAHVTYIFYGAEFSTIPREDLNVRLGNILCPESVVKSNNDDTKRVSKLAQDQKTAFAKKDGRALELSVLMAESSKKLLEWKLQFLAKLRESIEQMYGIKLNPSPCELQTETQIQSMQELISHRGEIVTTATDIAIGSEEQTKMNEEMAKLKNQIKSIKRVFPFEIVADPLWPSKLRVPQMTFQTVIGQIKYPNEPWKPLTFADVLVLDEDAKDEFFRGFYETIYLIIRDGQKNMAEMKKPAHQRSFGDCYHGVNPLQTLPYPKFYHYQDEFDPSKPHDLTADPIVELDDLYNFLITIRAAKSMNDIERNAEDPDLTGEEKESMGKKLKDWFAYMESLRKEAQEKMEGEMDTTISPKKNK